MSRGIVSRREEDGLLHLGSRGWGGVGEEECQREESLAGQGGGTGWRMKREKGKDVFLRRGRNK